MAKFFVFIALFISCTAKASESSVLDVIGFGAGIYGSIYIHELGHAVTAKYYGGYDIDIDVPRKNGGIFSGWTSFKLPEYSYESSRVIAVSGLVATTIASEIIIQNNKLNATPFGQGVLSTSLLSNVRYVYKYYYNDENTVGDLENYARADGYIDAFNTLLIGHTIWSLKRMRDKSIPLFALDLQF